MYWEESGTPDGIPALYLHGGPGGGLGAGGYRTKLDPARFRVLGFDQRGCGRSVPLANDPRHDVDGNTTQRLIADIEALRSHLGVDAWLLNGVSWGSTLALAYAQAHPERVLGIVLMAVTTTSRFEVDWITEGVGWSTRRRGPARPARRGGRIGYQRYDGRLVRRRAADAESRPGGPHRGRSAWAEWEDTHVSIGAGGSGAIRAGTTPRSARCSRRWSPTTGRRTPSWTHRSSTGSLDRASTGDADPRPPRRERSGRHGLAPRPGVARQRAGHRRGRGPRRLVDGRGVGRGEQPARRPDPPPRVRPRRRPAPPLVTELGHDMAR